MMAIPKKFTLGGVSWKVKESPTLPNASAALGVCSNIEATIGILSGLTQDVKEQTFCHELVHAIMFSMGKPGDTHDEHFVDGFATFLHQYLKQMTSKNPHTGEKQQTKPASDDYRTNYDKIFKKDPPKAVPVKENK